MTNFHVIRGASNIKVALIDSSVFPARVPPALCCLRVIAGAHRFVLAQNPCKPHTPCTVVCCRMYATRKAVCPSV